MVARHKRLALLHAANDDREFPLSRRDLIRQVASWEVREERDGRGMSKQVLCSARLRRIFWLGVGGGFENRTQKTMRISGERLPSRL